ncbi:unnamed protein product [Trichogramma brassicae]|uniref:Osiris 9 n=1 Tax=Trichogramma brassicae TaxID=86971 RepID=A0A6H5J2K6_9HYME|nr:unnamed protein product [Trichogramma brassicae]
MMKIALIVCVVALSSCCLGQPLQQEQVQQPQGSLLEQAYDVYSSCSSDSDIATRADNARSLNDIEASLPTELEARESAVNDVLYDRAARFLSTHTVELSMPEELSRSLGEARGKKKKIVKSLLPILLLLKLKAAALIPILLGGLALLAFKALIIGKVALIISAVLLLQKLFGNKHQSYEVVSHEIPHHHEEHHGGGWARSLEMAYAAHKPTSA